MLDPCFMEFKLDLQETKDYAAGTIISKEIAAGEYTLKVDCYPRGCAEFHSEYIDLVWSLLQASTPRPGFTKAIFEAFVVGADGEPSLSLARRSSSVEDLEPSSPAGSSARWVVTHRIVWGRFVKRSDLEPLQAADGTVTIVFGVVVMRDGAIAVPASDMGDHLGRLLDRPNGSDVFFSVGGEMFHAHRAVLAARSPVFETELLGSMAEARMTCITLHDIEPATFEALLRFAYTDRLPEDLVELAGSSPMDFFQHLLVAADRYGMDRLKLVCASKLHEKVTVDTVARVLACAERYNCPELKYSCMEFFLEEKNFKEAVLTEGFGQLVRDFPSIIGELRQRAAI
ncbi:unnamed protein product [Alopecurus aequalis]